MITNPAKRMLIFVGVVALLILLTGLLAAGRREEVADIPVAVTNYLYLKRTSPPETQALKIGDTVVISVHSVTPTPGSLTNPNVAELKLNFDKNVLLGMDVIVPDDLLSMLESIDNDLGKMSIDVGKIGPGGFAGDRVLAQFSFQVKALTGMTLLSLDAQTGFGYPNIYDPLTSVPNLSLNFNPPRCGDGIKNGVEVCDGDTKTCKVKSRTGTSRCNSTCTGYEACRV